MISTSEPKTGLLAYGLLLEIPGCVLEILAYYPGCLLVNKISTENYEEKQRHDGRIFQFERKFQLREFKII